MLCTLGFALCCPHSDSFRPALSKTCIWLQIWGSGITRLHCHCYTWRIRDTLRLYHFSGVEGMLGQPQHLFSTAAGPIVVVRLLLPALSPSLTCFSASLISSPPLCFWYTPSQSNKGMRGRRANKPVVVQRGRSGAGQRHEDRERRGNEEESEAAVPPGPNPDSQMCVCLPVWMNMYLTVTAWMFLWVLGLCGMCAPMHLWWNVCLCVWSCIQCVRLWLALQLLTRPTADYTALVLSSLYSVLHLLSAWVPAQN